MDSNTIKNLENAIVSTLGTPSGVSKIFTFEPTNFGDHATNLPAITLKLAPFKRIPEELGLGSVIWTWDLVIWVSIADPVSAQSKAKDLLGLVFDKFKDNPTLDNTVVYARITGGDGFIPVKSKTDTVLSCPVTLEVMQHEY